MKKSSSRKSRVGIFHGPKTAMALGMLLVAVVIVSFFSLQQTAQNSQTRVEGLMSQNVQGQNYQGKPGMMQQTASNFPMMIDPKLTCMSCTYSTRSSTPNICLSGGSSTTGPYAHCAAAPVNGETCAACPVVAVTPYPSCIPMPTQCQPGSPLGINCPNPPSGGWCPPTITPVPSLTPPPGCYYKPGMCPMMGVPCRVNPDGTSWCPPCKPILICPSVTPAPVVTGSVTGCTTQQICPDLGQKFMCFFWKKCGGCQTITTCANPASTTSSS